MKHGGSYNRDRIRFRLENGKELFGNLDSSDGLLVIEFSEDNGSMITAVINIVDEYILQYFKSNDYFEAITTCYDGDKKCSPEYHRNR